MRRRTQIFWVAAGIAVFLLLTAAILSDREPAYQGQTLSYWVIMRPRDLKEFQAKEDAIAHIGTNAIPCLVHWACYEHSPSPGALERILLRILRTIRIPINAFATPRVQLRADSVASAFSSLATNAAPALPMLAQLAVTHPNTDTAERARASIYLILFENQLRFGDITKPCFLLTDSLSDTNQIIREQASLIMDYYRFPAPGQTAPGMPVQER